MALDENALKALGMGGRTSTDAAPPRGWRRHLRLLGAVAAVLLLLAFLGLRGHPIEVETVAASAPAASGRVTVLNASGYVVARRIATVASKVTGRLIEVDVEEGAQVRAGQVLARLDPATATASLDVAMKSREAADRALRETEVRLADANRSLSRNRELKARNLVAQSALDTSLADVDALKARLEQSRAEVGVAKSTVRQRQQDLDDLVIRAPFTGVAISKDAQLGEIVSPISAGGGFTRTGIATIVDMDSRELEVDVNEAFIHRVHDTQPVEAILDAYPDAPVPAHVIRIVPTADRQKATIKVRIGLDRLEARILPDMGVKVRFLDEPAADAPKAVAILPDAAVVRDGSAAFVWRVIEGRAHRQAIRVGTVQNDDAPVLAGLTPGDRVVARPPATLKDGVRVLSKGP